MKTLFYSNSNMKKIGVNFFFIVVFIIPLLGLALDAGSYYSADNRITIYIYLTGVAMFYIHNLVLVPIKIIENNKNKYLFHAIICALLFTIVEFYFFWLIAHKSSNNIFGLNFNQLFRIEQLIRIIAAIGIPLIIIAILSFIYTFLLYGKNKVLPYLEVFVNATILLSVFVFSVFEPHMKGTEILIVSLILFIFYSNTFYATPILIKEQKKTKYVFRLLILCGVYYVLMVATFGLISSNSMHLPGISLVLFITILLSFVYGYVRLKIKSDEKVFNLKLGAKESELQLLKSQVNPHFLFNTLNTLYATALEEGAPKTAESTAKLASLIRYMQEDINKDFIPLEKEIKYLEDYILIQKLRCAVEPEIETAFKNIENHHISPGLLIPFVENAFKYGINPSKKSNLKVAVVCNENTIYFECINSYDDAFKTYYKEQGFGIGIKNAKQRLELVYPKNHTFEVKKESNIFSVTINIKSI